LAGFTAKVVAEDESEEEEEAIVGSETTFGSSTTRGVAAEAWARDEAPVAEAEACWVDSFGVGLL